MKAISIIRNIFITAIIAASSTVCHAEEKKEPPSGPLSWANNDGKTIKAGFVKLDGEAVLVRTEDGKEHKIPFTRLSPESVAQARQIGEDIAIVETVDKKIKKLPPSKVNLYGGKDWHKYGLHDQTPQPEDKIVILETTDGDIELKPEETLYFKIKKESSEKGVFYYLIDNKKNHAPIGKGAEYVKAVREKTGELVFRIFTVEE